MFYWLRINNDLFFLESMKPIHRETFPIYRMVFFLCQVMHLALVVSD